MKKIQFRAAVVLLALSAALCGCTTISSVFGQGAPDYSRVPADALKKAAQDIEKTVKEGNREPVLAGHEGLKLDAPEIVQAVRTR